MPDSPILRAQEKLQDAVKEIDDEVRELSGVVQALKSHVDTLKAEIEKLVTRHEFTPVKMLVYGLVGSTLAGVVGAIMSKVLTK